MLDIPTWLLFLLLFVNLLCSAFFSSSETAMMSIDNYRLKQLVALEEKWAMLAHQLLQQPDRLIGVILLGNNFVNIMASAISTLLALRLGGDYALAVATGLLTFVVLIFCEVTPKTFATKHPEKVIALSARVLWVLKKILFPITIFVNGLANFTIWLMGEKSVQNTSNLSTEQLKIALKDGDKTMNPMRKMILNLLELEHLTIHSIMTPVHEIVGINTRDSFDQILYLINNSPYDRLPVYEETLDQLIGIIHIRDTVKILENFSLSQLLDIVEPCHFIPEKASLSSQLLDFQRQKRKLSFVVDEYGKIKGLITIEDILSEVIGEYTTNITDEVVEYEYLNDGSLNVTGEYSLRELKTTHHIDLEDEEVTTVHGFLLEIYGDTPPPHVSIKYKKYIFEVKEVTDDFITLANIKTLEQSQECDKH